MLNIGRAVTTDADAMAALSSTATSFSDLFFYLAIQACGNSNYGRHRRRGLGKDCVRARDALGTGHGGRFHLCLSQRTGPVLVLCLHLHNVCAATGANWVLSAFKGSRLPKHMLLTHAKWTPPLRIPPSFVCKHTLLSDWTTLPLE